MKKILFRSLLCTLLCLGILLSSGCQRIFDSVGDVFDELPGIGERTNAPLEGELLPSTGTYLYGEEMAEGNVQYVYDLLKEHVLRTVPGDSIALERSKKVTYEEASAAIQWFCADHPEAFWFDGGFQYSSFSDTVGGLEFTYLFTGDALNTARVRLDHAVNEILKDLPAEGDAFEKALYLHDAVAEKVFYEKVGHHQTAYGALVDGKAVCAGYASAYQLLLQRAGISACTVSGVSKNPGSQGGNSAPERHAWNMVWLDPNTCVYTDVTWDDQDDIVFHQYFNLSYAEIRTDHTEDAYFELPTCNHETFSYFDRNNRLVINSDTAPEEAAACFEAVQAGKWSAVLYYEDERESFEDWISRNMSRIYRLLAGQSGSSTVRWSRLGNEYSVVLERK